MPTDQHSGTYHHMTIDPERYSRRKKNLNVAITGEKGTGMSHSSIPLFNYIPRWRFIFLEFPKPIAVLGDGFVYGDSPINYICPDCNQHLTVGIHIIEGKSATYYSKCWGCGFDIKTKRELDEEGFNLEKFMDTI